MLSPTLEAMAIIDADCHPGFSLRDPRIAAQLPLRWRRHVERFGERGVSAEATIPRQREHGSRLDAKPPGGGVPGSDPAFAAEQLLDRHGIGAAILNNTRIFGPGRGAGNGPRELAVWIARTANEWTCVHWLPSDPRWHAAICIAFEAPDEAVREIQRVKEGPDGGRFVQILVERRSESPFGNPRYWPILEAAEHYRLPVAFHTGAGRRITACGQPSYYFEEHCDFALSNFSCVASLVFEGAFERFPGLRIVLVEQNWAWAPVFGWRMDRAHRMLREEVPHLRRAPSEYLREHCWFTTQPAEEPERAEWFGDVWSMFEDAGLAARLMYSSDYPHWDFDPPQEAVRHLPAGAQERILAGNAGELYAIRPVPALNPPRARESAARRPG